MSILSFRSRSSQPLTAKIKAPKEEYLRIYEEAKKVQWPAVDEFEDQYGYKIDRGFLDELALHTQIVIKKSAMNYQHGRVLYAALRKYISERKDTNRPLVILETGTARGFSSLCMAKAMEDAGVAGSVYTFDILPHEKVMYWNCIDDHEGQQTRRSLLSQFSPLVDRVIFFHGETMKTLGMISLPYIDFAYLDAVHTYDALVHEIGYVAPRQKPGEYIVFDDVTPSQYPGVVQAVDELSKNGQYEVSKFQPKETRGYAVAKRL